MGPVRSVSCKAETPPKRSPPGLMLRCAGRYKNRSSTSSIQTSFREGSGILAMLASVATRAGSSADLNERSTTRTVQFQAVLDGYHYPPLLLISLSYSRNRIDLCHRSIYIFYQLSIRIPHTPLRVPQLPCLSPCRGMWASTIL